MVEPLTPRILARAAGSLLPVRPDNLVQRPWGGQRLLALKGLPATAEAHRAGPFGEVFEVSAWAADPESHAHPSHIRWPDGSEVLLPALLELAPEEILGPALASQHGPGIPLLPKTLHVRELLSVQSHPHPELYVVLEAEAGATIRLGWRREVCPRELAARLQEGRRRQEQVLALLEGRLDQHQLQSLLGGGRLLGGVAASQLATELAGRSSGGVDEGQLRDALLVLQDCCGEVLDLMQVLPVRPGQIIRNAASATGGTSLVHALGNPEGRSILLLEIRPPGPTLRAWDHGRFPLRDLQIEEALALAPTTAVDATDLLVAPRPAAGPPGGPDLWSCEAFEVELVRLGAGEDLSRHTHDRLRTLHVIQGDLELQDVADRTLGSLEAARSGLVPASLGFHRLRAGSAGAQAVQASIPLLPAPPPPAFLRQAPVELAFGTSGLRGLVRDMTDLEVHINTLGFLRHLQASGELRPGDPVALAEDRRDLDPTTGLSSSPRIARAVAWTIRKEGLIARYCGRIPTPALAAHAAGRMPCIMVTGSHIPADRNGVKFYGRTGEVLKRDEGPILTAVHQARASVYARDATEVRFDQDGMLRDPLADLVADEEAAERYVRRYLDCFAGQRPLAGQRVVHLQHSAVGRDLLARILTELGAEVVVEGRSESFIAVDTEDVMPEDEARYRTLVLRHEAHALVSTDGDGDRPLLVDQEGRFHRGDLVGLVTAELLQARCAVVPVSATDAIELRQEARRASGSAPPLAVHRTRIGSPHVIEGMQAAVAAGDTAVVGWEANGGFLTATDLPLGSGRLPALPTRDAVLPILAVLLASAARRQPISELFSGLPRRATRVATLDAVPQPVGRRIVGTLTPGDAGEPTAHQVLERLADLLGGIGTPASLSCVDGVRVKLDGGEVVHLRPSGNAPQMRVYVTSDTQERSDAIVAEALRAPDGFLHRLVREVTAVEGCHANLEELRLVVDGSLGPTQVLAVVNQGDAAPVRERLEQLAPRLFRADGHTDILVHEEVSRRGQLLGLVDAHRHWTAACGVLDTASVALGIMLPGKGTRLSPLTQRLHGIKPFLPVPVRHRPRDEWCTAAEASLYTSTLVVHHLQRMGFRGVLWKWGDEPQIAATSLAALEEDLSAADAVRFGARTAITEELALHKDWLQQDPVTGQLLRQVSRRPRAELLAALGVDDPGVDLEAHVHAGSPAFSHWFLEEATAVLGDLEGWLDVDGYLFQALTLGEADWRAEVARDPDLQGLLWRYPDFRHRVQLLRERLEDRRGHALEIKVLDLGDGMYWGDVGQLSLAHEAYARLTTPGPEGELARQLAALTGVERDQHGNLVLASRGVPTDGSVRGCVILHSHVHGPARMTGAVVVDSQVGRARLDRGAVAVDCTVGELTMEARSLAFRSVAPCLLVPGGRVHTSIPADPLAVGQGLEDWWEDLDAHPGLGSAYAEPRPGNPTSHQDKFRQMRQRQVPPAQVEAEIEALWRAALRQEQGLGAP